MGQMIRTLKWDNQDMFLFEQPYKVDVNIDNLVRLFRDDNIRTTKIGFGILPKGTTKTCKELLGTIYVQK